jgi:hypothetical protein
LNTGPEAHHDRVVSNGRAGITNVPPQGTARRSDKRLGEVVTQAQREQA